MRTPRLFFCIIFVLINMVGAGRATLAPPCEWDREVPKGNVKIRGLLEVARYHASPNSQRWSKAYILMPTRGGCIVQVEAPKERLAPCDGYVVDLVGPVRWGGAIAAFTLTVREIHCLHRYENPENTRKSSNQTMQLTTTARSFGCTFDD